MSLLLGEYDLRGLSVATLGSHSALDICRGAKSEGFPTIVACQRGREKTYSKYYLSRNGKCCVDHAMVLEDFKEIALEKTTGFLRENNAVFIPHRSFCVYVGYDAVNSFNVPLLGNRVLLQAEERTGRFKLEKNQDYLMEKAGIGVPKKYKSPEEIDSKVIVKISKGSGERHFKREFFTAESPKEFGEKTRELLGKGLTSQEQVDGAAIEELVEGPKINFNFFYSTLDSELELLGVDTRMQATNKEELAHQPASLKESLLERVFEYGEKLVEITQKEFKPGIIGPFALQCAYKDETPLVYDASFRIPGSPDTEFTPYAGYLHGKPVSFGKRIAMEIRKAVETGALEEIVT